MYRIYTKGNYFYAVNEQTGAQLEEHAKDVVIKRSTENSNKFSISRLFGLIDISEMKDESGTPYTLQGFIDFKNENTGKFSGTAENGSGTGSSDLKNVQATAILTLANDVIVTQGGTFDLTPDTIVTNTFGDVLQLDELNRLFTTMNNEQLNLSIDIFLALDGGNLEAFDVALQRGNETTLIERTKRQLFQRPAQGQSVGGPTGTTLSTYTSGTNDPFNNAGFSLTFFNPTNNDATILAGEVRIDIFGVYDILKTSV